MKKKFWVASLTVLILSCILCFSGCDLSHKHYNNEIGICKTCSHDSARRLTLTGEGEYVAQSEIVIAKQKYYYEFTADQTGNLQVKTSSVTMNLVSVLLYENTTEIGYSYSYAQSAVLSRGVEQGKTYRLVICYSADGEVQLTATIINV